MNNIQKKKILLKFVICCCRIFVLGLVMAFYCQMLSLTMLLLAAMLLIHVRVMVRRCARETRAPA